MFGSTLNAFSPQSSQWHVDLPGFSNEKASQTYGQCILGGGNENDCAGKGFEAGSGGSAKIVGTNESSSIWDRIKYYGLSGIGAVTGNPGLTATGLKATAAANGVGSLTVSRIATGLTGLILIAGAMFMFGLASFSPTGKILEAVKGSV